MKINRLVGILSVLLQENETTAVKLAQKFEVSQRTIYRDIDSLAEAGIPIYTTRGSGGGIRIIDDYRIDRTLLTSKEMQGILTGLRGIDSVSGSHYYRQLMEKIQAGSSELINGQENILIDLASWYQPTLVPKFQLIQNAIETNQKISFAYFAQAGKSQRQVEPYYLVFKWSNWYLWGWSTEKQDFRLFKLMRISQLKLMDEIFQPRPAPIPDPAVRKTQTNHIKFKALFNNKVAWRVVEEFGTDNLAKQTDGRLLLQGDYSNSESLYQWLLTFGNDVEILEPQSIKIELLQTAKKILQLYEAN
ncbi:DNA-binding transcriptional regulator [Levilactobacillus bambusae]|uniref:DNA-binding transcriptional regulator n=2 Tax=Levilactobacillus bambusae TaxID=2024736 RepID=A0A2V1MZW0_9LACO|nr:DNA-binding transcriptional regulator [Levilactobacillus bambusae]